MQGLGCSGLLRFLGSCALALAGCATQATAARTGARYDDSPVYDSVADWDADAARYAPPPYDPRPARPRANAPLWFAEPLFSLRPFSESEAARIRQVQPIVYAAGHHHVVPPDLVNGIIWVESRFKTHARSRVGACGLMQLMPSTAREIALSMGRPYDVFDPDFNIHAGTFYFAQMLERFEGNTALALAAYNIGPAVIDNYARSSAPLPAVSRAYVSSVFEASRAFRGTEL
jgi:soluble lytic murein transglycosylase-like protein